MTKFINCYKTNFIAKILKFSFLVCFSVITSSCTIFDEPTGTVDFLDVYTRDEQVYVDEYFTIPSSSLSTKPTHEPKTQEVLISYICATLKITNTSNRNIYNTTVNIQASAGSRTYYKTVSLDVTIKPGDTIFLPVEIEKNTKELKAVGDNNDAKWNLDSFKIISVSLS